MPFSLVTILRRWPPSRAMAKSVLSWASAACAPSWPADLLVAGDQQAAGQVGLGLAAGLEFFHQLHDERQGQGGGIFVIDAAAAEELAVFDAGLEQCIGRIHDVDVGHEQHRRAAVRPQHQQGRGAVLFDAAIGNARAAPGSSP